MQRPQIGACLGVSEDQEQEERCRYSLLSKRWGLGRTAMEAPSRAWALFSVGWKSLEVLSRVVV